MPNKEDDSQPASQPNNQLSEMRDKDYLCALCDLLK